MQFKKKILKNGLRLITVPLEDNPTVTAFVLVEAGTKYETKEQNGISHFLEHMCFKGTEKRPRAVDIATELDQIGAAYNAFTSHEYTGYYAKAAAKHIDTVLDVVSDIYLNPIFRQDEVDREKGVIIEEINMYEDELPRKALELFESVQHGDVPAGWSVLGPKENINTMTAEDFYAYQKKHYVAESTTVIVAGSFDEKEITKKVGNLFAHMNDNMASRKKKVDTTQSKPHIGIEYKKSDQAHMMLGVRGVKLSHTDQTIVNVMAGVLSAGTSSRLWNKLREEMGVCYYVQAFHDSYTDHGALAVWTGVNTSRVEEVMRVLLEELRRFTYELVSEKELKKVQETMVGGMLLGLESSDDVARFFGFQELLRKDIKRPKEVAAKIRSVTPKDIMRVAKKLIKTEKINCALVGPYKDAKRFKKLLAF